MSPLLAPILISVFLGITAFAGPGLIRRTAPVLMRVPRLAVVALGSSLLLWLLAVASLSLALAWVLTGPDVLPAPAADVCQRCLEAASPFGPFATVPTGVPVVLLVTGPAIAATAVLVAAAGRARHRITKTHELAREIGARSEPRTLHGYRVLVIDEERPTAFSVAAPGGGIVVSTGLERVLSAEELLAVLEHEHAHLRQRHHLLLLVVDAMTWPLRRLSMARTVAAAVPHYLEIAADNAARARTSTPALAAALLKLGACEALDASSTVPDGALRFAGPNRIRQLVAPPSICGARLPAWVLLAQLIAFAVIAVSVHGSYLAVVLTGCRLPG